MQENEWRNDPSKWFLGVFYFNREDKRLFPPKRIAAMGWTLNFAHRDASIIFVGLLLLLLVMGLASK